MDAVHDQFATGREIRIFTVFCTFTCFAPAIKLRFGYRAEDVVEVPERVVREHGLPKTIRVDQGTVLPTYLLPARAFSTSPARRPSRDVHLLHVVLRSNARVSIVSDRPISVMSAARGKSPALRYVEEVLSACGLAQPDGRPLYRYRISDDHFARGRHILKQFGSCLDPANRTLCAVFALVTAEWYRRNATSLFLRWADVGVVPKDMSPTERSDVVQAGLDWWRLTLRVGVQREFLLTLALNGGIPSSMLIGEERNRIRAFFETVMQAALDADGQLDLDQLIGCAQRAADRLPQSYWDDVIYQLAAELIEQLVQLRAMLPKEQALASPAGWLDANEAGWRNRLPIYLPEDPAACSRLFNTLLAVQPRAKGSGVGARRLLSRDPAGNWLEGFEVRADGQLAFQALADSPEGRFRAFFHGTAAALMSREFAQVYRSETEADGTFVVTVRGVGRSGILRPVPFAETIAVTLMRDGWTRPPVSWPHGQGRSGSCHVLRATDRDDRLELVGTGSVRSPLPTLFVWVARETLVRAHADGAVERVWAGEQKALWQVKGMALVTAGDGECYRVQSLAERAEDSCLDIPSMSFPNMDVEDREIVLVEAPLCPRAKQAPRDSSIRVLKDGQPIRDVGSTWGRLTLALQDAEGFLLDRVRVFVLPRAFELDGHIERAGAAVHWQLPEGWRVAVVDPDGAESDLSARSDDGFTYRWRNGVTKAIPLRLSAPDGSSLVLRLQLAARRTLLVDAAGRVRDDRPTLAPWDLRGGCLVTDRSSRVHLELHGAGHVCAVSRRIDGETPLVRFLDLAESLLGQCSRGSPYVRVLDERAHLCTVSRPQDGATIWHGQIRFPRALTLNEIAIARPLLNLESEHAVDLCPDGTYRVPERLRGPCLVYLRRGDAITARPVLCEARSAPPGEIAAAGRLAQAALIFDDRERQRAYGAIFTALAADTGAGGEISTLVRIIHSLRGLSPSALDVTGMLWRTPILLCRLLLAASAERVNSVLALERDLPFLWMALPISAWQEAAHAEWRRAVTELTAIPGMENAADQAGHYLLDRFNVLSDRTGWFASIQMALGFPAPLSVDLRRLAQDHVCLHAEDAGAFTPSDVAKARSLGLPPAIADTFSVEENSTLIAPFLLACVARGRLDMTPSLASSFRNALDIDELYVSSAFPHCLIGLPP